MYSKTKTYGRKDLLKDKKKKTTNRIPPILTTTLSNVKTIYLDGETLQITERKRTQRTKSVSPQSIFRNRETCVANKLYI